MSVSALTWAMDQNTHYPCANLVLMRLAAGSGGGGDVDWWIGSKSELSRKCGFADARDLGWALFVLGELKLIKVEYDDGDDLTLWLMQGATPDYEAWQVDCRIPHPEGMKNHGAKVSRTRRKRVMERDGYACKTCGRTDDLTLDHIYPQSKGGKSTEDNLRVLCRPCNSRKGARV